MSDLLDFIPSTDDIVVTLKVGGKVLKNPDKTDMTITIMAPSSAESRSVTHKLTDARIKKARERKDTTITSEEAEKATLETFVKTTKDWNITIGGEQPKFTEAKAREIYSQAFWIPALLQEAKEDSLDFMKA